MTIHERGFSRQLLRIRIKKAKRKEHRLPVCAHILALPLTGQSDLGGRHLFGASVFLSVNGDKTWDPEIS
jgi:hypothetical protein